MAQRHNTEPEQSLAPVLVFPTQEAVVDGRHVTFAWETVPEATEHVLQVARDPDFEEIVLEESVDERTSLVVDDGFTTEGDTFYWRLLLTDAGGRRHGEDHIESFVAAAEARATVPHAHANREDEDLGPVGELLRGAAAEAAAEVTHDEKYFRREIELGVAHEGVASGQILALGIAVLLAVALAVVTLFQYTQITAQEVRYGSVGLSGYPELQEVRQTGAERLGEYDVIDSEQDIYQIPIDRAIELMVEEAGPGPQGAAPETQLLPGQPGPDAVGTPAPQPPQAETPAANQQPEQPQQSPPPNQ